MTIRTCDRCGSKISTNPMANAILPMFSISRIEDFAMGRQSVDLCPRCEKKLAEWLNNKEDNHGKGEKMIILDIQNPQNTFDCPFLEEDSDSELHCYFDPDVNARCAGLYNNGCHIIRCGCITEDD